MASGENWERVPLENWERAPIEEGDGLNVRAKEQDQIDEFAEEYAIPFLQRSGANIVKGVGAVSEAIDKYTGAPVRAGIMAGIEDKPIFPSMVEQFGADPTKSPSGKDIASKIGMSTDPFINTGLIINPFTGKKGELKISPAGIAGAAIESVDPTAAIPFLGRTGLKTVKSAVDLAGFAGRKVAPIAGKLIARVPTDITKAYMADPERIENVAKNYSKADLSDLVSNVVREAQEDVDITKAKTSDVQQKLQQKLREKKLELQRGADPSETVKEIQGSLIQQQQLLKALSERADRELVRSGATFSKQDLIAAIDKIGASVGPDLIGDEVTAAVKKLDETRQRLQSLPDVIPATRLRNILKQIRQDINYHYNIGQKNEQLDLMKKTFTHQISEALKAQAPEYAKFMNLMAKRAQSLEKMSEYFGTAQDITPGIGTLEGIRKGQNWRANNIAQIVRENAELTKNQKVLDVLNRFESEQDILNRMKQGRDLSSELFPQEYNALQEALAERQMAQDIYEPMSRLGGGRDSVESAIRRYKQPTASVEANQAIEAAGKASGKNLPQMIGDRAIYDQFAKDATAGSRGTLAGLSLGQLFGDDLAKIALAMTGFAADRYGGSWVRGGIRSGTALKRQFDKAANFLLNDFEFAKKYGPYFKGAAGGGTVGAILAHQTLMNNDPEYRALFAEDQ